MSFFGKLKISHNGPPAPPIRTDNNAGFEWPQDEFDDEEEGDTYEAPPCERPAVKVPPRPVEENVYLGPPTLRRFKPPESYYDLNTKKPPEINRNEKPGRKIRPAPTPVPPSTEEDVYLDPNEEQVKQDKEWFAGDCSRKTAEDLLQRINKDGAFLIRHSSAQSVRQPYTLAVLYQQKVYNIPIRFLEDTRGYALGKEGKKNEEIFTSLEEMISHHKNNQLLLIDSMSQAKHTAHLTHPALLKLHYTSFVESQG